MCGIAGVAGTFVPGLVARMNQVLAHRGPDGQGLFERPKEGIALGHQRLAIIDLSDAAAQPMYSADGRYVIVYNGELYNYRELRLELEAKGYGFRSHSDTEVVLAALILEGQAALARFNGMFAFALWDNQKRELLIARDQLGIKPLYFVEPVSGQLVFASEIKAILLHPAVAREPDFVALQHYLTYGEAAGTRTPLRQVKRLMQGQCLTWSAERGTKIANYWQPDYRERFDGTRAEAVERLRETLARATTRQMVADVPVGAFLSGGLDSTLITSLAIRGHQGEFDCYTTYFGEDENRLDGMSDDGRYARKVAKDLGVRLHEIEVRPDVAELWPKLIWHLDEPLADPAAISCFMISQLARENGTKVLLSGQGADELFGGYPRYMAMHLTRCVDRLPGGTRRLIAASAKRLPGAREGALGTTLRRVRRTLSEIEEPAQRRFLRYCTYVPQDEVSRILAPEVRDALGGEIYMDECLRHMEATGLQGVDSMLERDLTHYLPNHNLLYTDKMAMATGIEARVPLLDIELVEQVTRYPKEWLFSGRQTKSILREAARGTVSDEVIYRRKAGFGAPYRKWLRYDLSELWGDLTSPESVLNRGWFVVKALADARRKSQTGEADLYMLQWAVITLELWARSVLDK